jgi:hypothetical protein
MLKGRVVLVPIRTETDMTGRIPKRAATLAAAILAATALLAVAAGAASAATIYNNIPSGQLASESMGSNGIAEFGGQVEFKAAKHPKREVTKVTVEMSTWACETGSAATCTTRHKKPGFSVPITLNVYEVNPTNNEPVLPALITVTETFSIPYRPSENPACPEEEGSKGYSSKDCENTLGMMDKISFTVPATVVPNRAIIAVAYSTPQPLNVAVNATWNEILKALVPGPPPSVGADPSPANEDAYLRSTTPGASLLLESGWLGFQPAFEVKTT